MMKFVVALAVLAVAVLASARPDVLDFEGEDHQHQQEGDAGEHVEGSYSWTSPEGEEFHVQYVADEDGYRVLESNAVPVNHDGMAADGNQGAFGEEEGEGDLTFFPLIANNITVLQFNANKNQFEHTCDLLV
nr:cuticular protein 47Eg-like [Penaeus vannamei]